MKKILMGVAGVIGVAVLGLLGAASMQPDSVHLERATIVAAPASDVFPFANDYANWSQWDPWRSKDPDQKTEVSDPSAGVGAWSSWDGNDEVGAGKQTITASTENEKVVQDLEFFRPMEMKAVASITLSPAEGGTKVVWSYDAQQDLIGKAFTMFMDMDAMMGPEFDKGLASLKGAAEAASAARIAAEKEAADAAAAELAAAEVAEGDEATATP